MLPANGIDLFALFRSHVTMPGAIPAQKMAYILCGSRLCSFIVCRLFGTASVSVCVSVSRQRMKLSIAFLKEICMTLFLRRRRSSRMSSTTRPPPLRFSPIPLWKGKNRTGRKKEKKKTRTDGGLQGTYIYCHSEQVLRGHALKPFISAKFYHKGRSH